jgi:hypothetical protein
MSPVEERSDRLETESSRQDNDPIDRKPSQAEGDERTVDEALQKQDRKQTS